jgi:hypothetical protein
MKSNQDILGEAFGSSNALIFTVSKGVRELNGIWWIPVIWLSPKPKGVREGHETSSFAIGPINACFRLLPASEFIPSINLVISLSLFGNSARDPQSAGDMHQHASNPKSVSPRIERHNGWLLSWQ